MSRSYFTTKGINKSGSGSSGSGSDLEAIKAINKTISTMQIDVSSIQNTVNGLVGLSSKLSQIASRISELEKNKINTFDYYDIGHLPSSVYTTNYINTILTSSIPTVYENLDMTEKSKDNPTKLFSANCILNIPNIRLIPTVYDDFNLTEVTPGDPKVLSASKCINEFNKLPTIQWNLSESVAQPSDDKNVYNCTYINNLNIPTLIYDIFETNPINGSMYSAEYINSLKNTIPIVYNDIERTIRVQNMGEVYSCDVIDKLPLPNDIKNSIDTHTSSDRFSDKTMTNVYNTYYVDQWFDLSRNEKIGEVEDYYGTILKLRLYQRTLRKTRLKFNSEIQYEQIYGDDSQMFSFGAKNRLIDLSWSRGDNGEPTNISEFSKNENVEPFNFKEVEDEIPNFGGVFSVDKICLSDAAKYLFHVYNDDIVDENSNENDLVPDDPVPNINNDNTYELYPTKDYKFIKYSKFQLLSNLSTVYPSTDGTYSESMIFGFYEYNTPLTYMYNRLIKSDSGIKSCIGFNGDTTNSNMWEVNKDMQYVFIIGNDSISSNRNTTINGDLLVTNNGTINGNTTLGDSRNNYTHIFTGSNVGIDSPNVVIGKLEDDDLTINSRTMINSETIIKNNSIIGDANGQNESNFYGKVKINGNSVNISDIGLTVIRTVNYNSVYGCAVFGGNNMNVGELSKIVIGNSSNDSVTGLNILYHHNIGYTFKLDNDDGQFHYENSEFTMNKPFNLESTLIVDGECSLNDNLNVTGDSVLNTLTTNGDITSNGNLNVTGTTTLNGNLNVGGIINQTSDARLKTNIMEMNDDIISNLSPKSFELKSAPSKKRYGFIAQDIQNILPELVCKDDNNMLSVNYIDIIAHLVHHIQQQDKRISDLETIIKSIKNEY